jgi:ribosome recycling factor
MLRALGRVRLSRPGNHGQSLALATTLHGRGSELLQTLPKSSLKVSGSKAHRGLANREQRNHDKHKMKQKQAKQKAHDDAPSEAGSSFDTSRCKLHMESIMTKFKQSLSILRVGRAVPSFLDAVVVNAYGAPTPLKALAQVTVKGPQLLVVNVHDTGLLKSVEKAINGAGLGVSTSIENNSVHVPLPKPTREYRDELIKQASRKAEETKAALRQARQTAMNELKKANLPQDDNERGKQRIQKQLDDVMGITTQLLKEKETEINTV